jgi:hypothetical protein
MRRMHLIETVADEGGITYRAGDDVPALVDLLRTKYAIALKARAEWLVQELGDLEQAQLNQRIVERIGRWAVEFQGEIGRPGTSA